MTDSLRLVRAAAAELASEQVARPTTPASDRGVPPWSWTRGDRRRADRVPERLHLRGRRAARRGVRGDGQDRDAGEHRRAVVDAARAAGATVMHAPITFAEGYNEITAHPYGILKGVVDGNAFVKGTWGAAIVDELAPADGDIVIEGKRGLDTFASTNLDFILRSKGITTRRARRLPHQLLRRVDDAQRLRERLQVITLTDCVAATSQEEHDNAIEVRLPDVLPADDRRPSSPTRWAAAAAGRVTTWPATAAIELEVAGRTVRVSNPDKIYFPAARRSPSWTWSSTTSRSATASCARCGSGRRRWTLAERLPRRAIARGDAFYQKRMPTKGGPTGSRRRTITFPERSDRGRAVPGRAGARGLGGQARHASMFHPWPVARGRHRAPGRAAHRPGPAARHRLRRCRARSAVEVRALLDELGCVGLPEDLRRPRACTSTCASRRSGRSSRSRRAVIAFAREIERRMPDLVTTKWWKEERGERVFIDFNQMARDRTIACAYSRAGQRPGDRLHPGDLGGADRTSSPTTSPCGRCRRGSPRSATRTPRSTTSRTTSRRCWSGPTATNATTAQGDMPYPPDHPKMPGEPTRVQPSRAKH